MQPDYNKLWYNLNMDSQAIDAHFYAFYEDSLNQFISTNSSNSKSIESIITRAKAESLNESTRND